MNLVLAKGHSRVPVYYEEQTNIIGLILVNLLIISAHIASNNPLYNEFYDLFLI